MIDEQKLRQLAEASNLSISERADMNEAEFSASEDKRREFRRTAPDAILSLLDELQSLREECTALLANEQNLQAAVKQARIDALEEARSIVRGYVIHAGDADRLSCAIESLKGTP